MEKNRYIPGKVDAQRRISIGKIAKELLNLQTKEYIWVSTESEKNRWVGGRVDSQGRISIRKMEMELLGLQAKERIWIKVVSTGKFDRKEASQMKPIG